MHPDVAPVIEEGGTAGLLWGVKNTFLQYVSGLPDGVLEVSPQVHLPGNGIFGFPMKNWSGNPPTSFRFAGNVTFRGHQDFLFVQLADLGVDLLDGEWRLTARRPDSASERIIVATSSQSEFDLEVGSVHISVVLAPDGSELFAGNYRVGEPLSDLLLILPKTAQQQSNTHNPRRRQP